MAVILKVLGRRIALVDYGPDYMLASGLVGRRNRSWPARYVAKGCRELIENVLRIVDGEFVENLVESTRVSEVGVSDAQRVGVRSGFPRGFH